MPTTGFPGLAGTCQICGNCRIPFPNLPQTDPLRRLAPVPPDMRHLPGRKGLQVRNVLLIVALMLGASPAMGQSLCVEPAMPMPLDGAAATADQMRTAMAAARNFIAESGVYQDCLLKEIEDAKSQAAAGQPVEPAVEANARAKLDASKKAQERVGVTVNNAMAAYKNA